MHSNVTRTDVSLRELAVRDAALQALAGRITAARGHIRRQLATRIADTYRDSGQRVVDAVDEDGQPFAHVTVGIRKAAFQIGSYVDYLDWVKKNHPDEVLEKVSDGFEKNLLTKMVNVTDDAEVILAETGEVLDWMRFIPGGGLDGEPRLFFSGQGRAAALDLLNSGAVGFTVQNLVEEEIA